MTRNLQQKTKTRSQADGRGERGQTTEEEAVILHLHQVAAVEKDHDVLQSELHPTAVTAAMVVAVTAAVVVAVTVAAAATAATAVATETDQALTGESTPRNPKWVVSQTDAVEKKLGSAGSQITIGQG